MAREEYGPALVCGLSLDEDGSITINGWKVFEDRDHPTATYRASYLLPLTEAERRFGIRDELWAETLHDLVMVLAADMAVRDMLRQAIEGTPS